MNNLQRDDIHFISRHSNVSEKAVDKALRENVYNDKDSWQKFLHLFLISLGIGFSVAGIIFFFAYNWADLDKFAKIGLTQGLVVIMTCLVLIPKINLKIRDVVLTGAAMLVGVLFAVFGQIYQTGANAYDFFLAWTVFITLWVVVANFAPLWLLYIILINTTFILYTQQIARDWSEVFVFTLLFVINTIALISFIFLAKYRKEIVVPKWFLNIVALAATSFATIGIVFGIFENERNDFIILIVLTTAVFVLGIWYGLKSKSAFYLSIIPFSLIVIVSSLLLKGSDGESMFVLVGLFIIASVTLVIRGLIGLQKKWTNEE